MHHKPKQDRNSVTNPKTKAEDKLNTNQKIKQNRQDKPLPLDRCCREDRKCTTQLSRRKVL